MSSLWVLGSVGRLVRARQPHRALDCQDGRAPVRDTLFILLTPFIRTQNGLQGAWLRTHWAILLVGQSTQRELPTALSRWRAMCTMELTCTSSQRFPADSGEPLWLPISLLGLLSFVLGALSCLLEVTALYSGAYFDELVGGGEFSVHLCHIVSP